MRAAVLAKAGGPLEVETLADPVPEYGEVRLAVTSCGVCHTDLHVMRGEVAFPLPAVLGHEVVGSVLEVGPGVSQVQPGDRVVTSFIIPCGTCRRCVRGEEELCETFFAMNRLKGTLYDGDTRLHRDNGSPVWMYSMGGLAEQCIVPATDVFPLPGDLDPASVATLGCSVLTAYGAARHVAGVRAGDTVGVVAAGGVGLSLVELLAFLGASEIVVADVAEDKLEMARRLGATATVNVLEAAAGPAVTELTHGRGLDVVFEALGSAATFDTALQMVTDGGAVVVIGIAPAGVTGSVDLARLARRKLRILGSYGGRPRTDIPALVDLVARGRLAPSRLVTRHFSLDQADAAYQALADGAIVGRAVVTIDGR
jgi:succinate semialdehyde reductase (NADPH)